MYSTKWELTEFRLEVSNSQWGEVIASPCAGGQEVAFVPCGLKLNPGLQLYCCVSSLLIW